MQTVTNWFIVSLAFADLFVTIPMLFSLYVMVSITFLISLPLPLHFIVALGKLFVHRSALHAPSTVQVVHAALVGYNFIVASHRTDGQLSGLDYS